LIIYVYNKTTTVHQVNEEIDRKNQELKNEYDRISKELDILKGQFSQENQNYNNIKQEITLAQQILDNSKNNIKYIQNNIVKTTENQKELSQKAFENYCEVLEKNYEDYEKEYEMQKDALETAYSNRQLELMREMDEVKQDLDQIKATRDAAIKAQLKEQEIKDKLSFYCLSISNNDLDDIKVLEKFKTQLHNPRILSMLIWKTFIQTPANKLCENVLGSSTVCGIYKITNQKNNMCYVGKSVDIKRRWTEHIKCGVGIDTPANNKLYKAMQEEGLQNFSFEVLEKCPREQLDEKEKYYIELYQSIIYGYNILAGAINK
jgi:archaellum component FlaC